MSSLCRFLSRYLSSTDVERRRVSRNDGRIRTDRDDWTGGSHSHIWSDVFYLYRKEIDGVLLFHSCGSVCRSKSDGMRSYDAVMKSQGRRDGVGCDDDCGDGEKMA